MEWNNPCLYSSSIFYWNRCCYQSRHVSPLICLKNYQWNRSSGCSDRGQEEDQIYMPGTNIHLHSNCHWDLRGFRPTDTTVFTGPWQSAQTGYRWQKLLYLPYSETVCVSAERKRSIGAGNSWALRPFFSCFSAQLILKLFQTWLEYSTLITIEDQSKIYSYLTNNDKRRDTIWVGSVQAIVHPLKHWKYWTGLHNKWVSILCTISAQWRCINIQAAGKDVDTIIRDSLY